MKLVRGLCDAICNLLRGVMLRKSRCDARKFIFLFNVYFLFYHL